MKFSKPNPIITLKEMDRMTNAELIGHIRKFEPLWLADIPSYYDKGALMDILNFNLNRYAFAFYF